MIKIVNVRLHPDNINIYVGEMVENGASITTYFVKWVTMPSGKIALIDWHNSIIAMVDTLESDELIIDINEYDNEYSELDDEDPKANFFKDDMDEAIDYVDEVLTND